MAIERLGIPAVRRIKGAEVVNKRIRDPDEEKIPTCNKDMKKEDDCPCFSCMLNKARGSMPNMSKLPGKI
jgi:hypothetical protein